MQVRLLETDRPPVWGAGALDPEATSHSLSEQCPQELLNFPLQPCFLFSRPKALATIAAPFPGPRVPLALPTCPTAALCPVPVPCRTAPLAGAPVPFAPAAPLARLALLLVARSTAPLAGAAIVPVTQPAAPLAGATQLSGPAAPASAAARGEDAGRARLRQAA